MTRLPHRIVTAALLGAFFAPASLLAPAICRAEGFPEPFNSEKDAAARPLPAVEAAARMETPAGLSVGVFAAEPDVQNPIAMAWDPRGRLWIAENHTYAERPIKMETRLRDRVLIFADHDGDGRADERKVFLDDLQQLTSLEVGLGGIWLLCPPRLLFVPDRDGNDVPDGPAKVILDGFEVAKENYHNFANGLRFGPDGWLYGRCGASCPGLVGPPAAAANGRVRLEGGIWRYSPRSGRFEALCHGTTNPWGHDWNAFGDGFFINTVNGHLWQIIPGAHYQRPHTIDPNPHVYELIDMHADHWHFDTGGGWQKSRDGAANDLGGGHAHSGMMIYLGDDWPEDYRGHLFTWNFHGRRANQERLEREGSGYVGRHGRDILLSADPFFRGMELAYGSDGAVLAIDWSDTGECHEATGVHRTSGRIFRIAHRGGPRPGGNLAAGDLASLSCVALADLTTHANEWYPRQARIILADRAATGPAGDLPQAHETLRRFAASADPVVACRALLTLHASGGCDQAFLRQILAHPDEHLRAWGVRLLGDDWPIDGVIGPATISPDASSRLAAACDAVIADLCRLARDDSSGLVRLALASTIQRMPVNRRAELAAALLQRGEDADDHNLPLLVWYGMIPVVEADPRRSADIAVASRWPMTQRLIARRLASLIDRHPEGMDRLVAAIAGRQDEQVQQNLLAGIADGLAGWRRAPKPAGWDALATRLSEGDSRQAARVRDLSAVFGDGRAIDGIRRLVLDEKADTGIRLSALETLVRQGEEGLRGICLGLLGDQRFNLLAAEGLSRSDDADVAKALVAAYGRFRAPFRPKLIGILASRRTFADALLDAVADGKIPRDAITAYDLRQIRSLGDARLDARIEGEWGGVAETSAGKRRRIDSLKESLSPETIAAADTSQGRRLFDASCGRCHKLFGAGESIGPDLTGGNRANIDYLLENIVDPSGVVNRDYRMSIIALADGRVLSGLVTARDDRTLTLVTPTDRHLIAAEDIDEVTITQQSPMPEGMLDQLSPEAIRDLIGYLMQPAQVPLPEAATQH
jgi:putative membrane-bound dehydrogenase-like protein